MSALSLFGLAKVSGTLVIDAQGKLTILPEGMEPRPGDVVINVLNDTEVGEDLDLVLIQEEGESQEIDVSDIDAEEIIAAIEAGEDPTQNEDQATAAGEANGSSPTTTGAIERDGSQTLAQTQFDTSGLEAQGLTATQSNTLLQVLVNSAPQILSEALAGNAVEAGHNSDGSDFDGTAELAGQLLATDLEFDDATLTWNVTSTPDNLSDYGEFELSDNGEWTFRLNNDSDATQALNVNDTVTLSFIVQVTDPLNSSTSQPFVITISGTNDKPVISANSEISGDIVEAGHNDDGSDNTGTASVSGQLNATDVDSPTESLIWSEDGDVSSAYGDFSITEAGLWTFELDNTADEVQALREGQSTSLEFKVKVTDDQGVDVFQTIVINIQGTNDKPVIDSELVTEGEVRESGHFDNGTEDAGVPNTGGQLSATDVDSSNLTWSPVGDVSNPYGTFNITSDGLWSFVIDNEADAVEALNENDTEQLTFTVQVEDEQGAIVTQTISVTVKGTNDKPVIDSEVVTEGEVRESGHFDSGTEDAGVPSTGGQLSATDVDSSNLTWSSVGDVSNPYGTFNITSDGLWSFVIDNEADAVEALAEGDEVPLSFTVQVEDEQGAVVTQTISVTVKGTNDAPVIDSAKDIGRVREAGDGVEGKDVTRGRIEASDVDNGSELSYSVQDGGNTDYGTFSVNDNGRWKFELDNDSEMTDALAKGEKVTLNYVVVVTDEHGAEVTQAVSIIVKGTNDAPVIDSAKDIGRVREAGDGVEGKDVTRGRIEASDVDNGSELSYSVQDGGNTDYGAFSVNDNGRWKFELDNDSEMTDALAKGEKVTLNYVVVVTDEHGAEVTQAVSIIVKGTNDAPVIDSAKDIGRVREAGDGVEGKDVTRGRIEASDVDNGSELSYSVQDGGNTDYGTFSVNDNGRWKFELDNDSEMTDALAKGEKVTLNYVVVVTDEHGAEVTQAVSIIVKGTNDAPVIDSAKDIGRVREAGDGVEGKDVTRGRIEASDVDNGSELSYSVQDGGNTDYGTFSVNDNGRWKFELDNDSEMTDALAKGEKVTLNYVVVVTDEHGAEVTQAVSIIVKGTNDAPVIDSAKDIGRVREAGDGVEGKDVTRGRIEASDVDNGSELSYSVQDGGNTDYGTFSVNDNGRWKFELDNDSEMTDALAKGEKVTLNYVVVVTDEHGAEVTQAVSIIVKGTNDAPVIDSAKDIGRVREAGDGVEGKDVTRGRIEASDVDNGSELSYSVQDGGNTDYGTFSVNDNGRWKFELDNNLEATQQLTDGDKVRLEYTVIVTDEHGASVEQLVTIIVKGTNDGPASEDFSITLSGDDAIPVIFDTGEGSIEGDGTDHISDYEDDRSTTDGKTLSVVITELPLGGTLLYTENGATRAIVEADLQIEGGTNGTPFNPDNISYLPDESAQGFVLGIKDSQGLDSEASSQTDFLNWGSPGDNPGERILTLGDESIRIISTGGDLTQYRGDANHVGFGLGVGGGQGINEGETISIDFSERPATSVTLGLDGLGGYFDENLNNANESSVLVTVTLSDGSTRVLDPIQKTTTGNSDLDLDITISIDDLSGAEGLQIYGVTVGTEGNGNWELRYLETSLEDSFDYKALDSDGAFSNESTVTIDDLRTNLAPDAIDDPESYTLVQGDMGAGDQGWDMVDSIQAKYDGQTVNYNIDGTDRIGIPDGTTNGGPESQIQYNRNEEESEQLIIMLKEPAVDGAFSVTNLFANEGGAGSHEQGKWSAYLGDTLVASDYFHNESGNKGTFDIETGGFAYDKLVFESVDFTGGPARGTDSSDYFLQGIEVVGAGAYVFDHDEPVVIPLSEILSNDDAVDGDDIRITYVFGETQGDARIEGDNVIFDLPEGFAGRTEFQYQITDDKGGFDTATVNVLVNPGPISVSGLEIDTASVEEGESFSYNVTLDGSSNVKTFFDIEFGANGDDASANDVDPSTMIFSNGVTYNEVTGELEVPANVSDFTITLPTIDDNRYEGDEGFTLIVDGQSAAGDILDNDPITLSLSGGGEVSEDAGSVPFTLSLSNPSDVALTVALDRIDVDTDDDDFSTTTASYNDGSTDVLLPIVNGEITIPAGVINVNIQVGIQDNDVYEQDENFTLKVTEPAGLTVNGNVGVSANATISDDGQIDGQPGGDNDNDAPILDLDASESGTGYAATFTEGDTPIKVVDSDIDITDDIDVITSAEIKLTNPQANDSFVVNGTLPNGLSYISSTVAGALVLTISGDGTAEEYETALQLLEFSNDSEDPNTDPRSITIQVFDDQGVGSNTTTSTIAVVPVNDLPESEDFSFSVSGNDPVSVIFDTGTGSIEGDGTDHISDIEDDMNGQQVHVKITELPIGGTLYHDGEVITQTNVANGDTFDPTKITYEPDSDAQGFILGTKVVPTSSDMESTQDEFYNWGTEVDGKNRVLELSNSDGSTDNITINSNKGNLTQYRGDVQDNHVGHGLGIGGGQGINEGEWLSINFADRPATHVTLGLDGMGGYFYSGLGGQNESAVTIKVTLSNGDTVNYTPDVQKDTSGNDVLFHELSFSIDDLGDVEEGVLIAGVSVGTDGRGNWELRYLETALNDSFKYKAVDSDEGESPESIVTIVDERENNMPPTLDLDLSADGTGFDTNYQEGDSAIEVVDSDITIFDEKNVIHEAEIVFTNPKAGDNFAIDGATNPLLSGISYTTEVLDSGAIKITLSGEATPADYEAAIQLIEFSNSSQSPDDEDRVIEITTFDDAMQPSNTAVSTINFTAIADLVVAAAIGDEDNKIALDIQLPANSDATEVVISGIPEGATLFSGTDEIVVTNNAANILPSQLANLSIKPPQDSDVDFTLSVSGRDADDNVVEQHDLAVTVRPITDTPTLIVTGENIVSAINFENVNLGNSSWKGNISGAQLSVDTPDDLNSGDWGVITNRGEVGKEGVYLGNGEQNQIFEIEGRSGQQDSLFTSFAGTPGQFYELNFDAAARRSDSPMDIKLEKENSEGAWVEVETLRSYGSGEEHSLVVGDWSEDEQLFFQTPDSSNYRVVFESPEQNSYGALLDNIVLSARSNVGYEDTFIDISDISASLNDADGSEVLTLLIQGLPQGAVVTNGIQTSIIGSSGEVDISDWSDLNDLQIKVADVGTYPITIKAIASELDATYSPVDEVVSESINLIVLDNPEPSAPNTPPEVMDFEFFAPDDTIPLNFSDFATDSEDDASNTKATLVEITDEPEYGQLYFLSNSGERFDLDVGDVVEDSVDIFYDLEVGFDVSALGYNPQGDEPFGNGIVVTGGTYGGDKPHLGVEMEEIAFDSAGAAKQSGFYTKRDDERGQGKETEAKQSEFMSIKFTAGMMTRALVGVGSLTGQFSAAANGNGAAQVFVYLYAGGVLLDDNPIVMDNGVIDDHQAIIEVASDIPFDEMRIMPFNAEGKDAGFVLQSVKVTDGEVADQFDYRAIDSDGLPSLETATVNVNIMPNGNVDESEEVDYAVQGGSGVTVIHGTDGDDVLSGGLGNDVLTGGLGDDTFKWSEGDLDGSHDVITDFSQVEGNRDVIDLSEVFEDSNTSLEALLDNVAVGGDKITLTENDDNTSTLVNVTKGDKSVTIELEGVTGLSELDVQQLSNIIIIHDT